MPDMSGYETFEAFRQEEQFSTIPFIFMTALYDPITHRHGMNLGADDFLHKPFTADEAAAVIKARLSRQRMLANKLRES